MIRAGLGFLLLAGACLGGCALQPYRPQALQPEQSANAFLSRDPDDPAVRAFFEAQGLTPPQWPLTVWGLQPLTLLALHFHPELEVARANAALFQAAVEAAAQPAAPGARPRAEHHSQADGGRSHWSYGLELDFPLAAPGKWEASIEQARNRAEAAESEAVTAVWRVASRVRSRLADLRTARADGELAREEHTARGEEVSSVHKRFEAGAADSAELSSARLRLEQAVLQAQREQGRAERAAAQLADALGLPPARVAAMVLDFSDLEPLPAAPEAGTAREAALRNRGDIHRGLLRYAEADAGLRLAVANQYPDLHLNPGYLWDQGDRIWTLALDIPLQLLQNQEAAVREAEARRELEARSFAALQARVIAEVEAALTGYRGSLEELAGTRRVERLAQDRSARMERALAAGAAERSQALAARIEVIGAKRARLLALAAAQRARAALEDAMEQRLEGPPSPNLPVAGRGPGG